MSDITLAIILTVVVTLVVLAIWIPWTRRKSRLLQEKFGPEYDHVLEERGDRREAERELEARRKRVAKLDLKPLDRAQQERFDERWQDVQREFVDGPSVAVADAQDLVEEVMEARGYPVGDLTQEEADVSVEKPEVVSHFRRAREIAERNERAEASTEDLRQAMKHYRELFQALIQGGRERAEAEETEKVRG